MQQGIILHSVEVTVIDKWNKTERQISLLPFLPEQYK